ncbi:hypothetical protein Fcan01_16452 [Folsomia candida]|uniref:Uncharacterized protein n=1 Tax=Folsomia candida TaxID=158441 RepID=A0A226DW65_FOLCA|nr:hypothetical protein Fcan01_16452 [Folsomia candida]
MSYKFNIPTILVLFLLIYITDARYTLDLQDFGPCLISLNHFGPKPQILGDLVDQVLEANRLSVLMIRIVTKYPSKIEETEPLEKCTIYVIFVLKSKVDWAKIEKSIFTSTFAYRSDYASSIILLRPGQSSPPKLAGCKYKMISVRIFSLAVILSNCKATNIDWSFHCYLCSGNTWIRVQAEAKMSEIVRINHLTFRDRLDPKKSVFNVHTTPTIFRRFSGCEYAIWRIPKNPCHPNQMVQDFLSSQLNATFRRITSFSDIKCG